MATFPVVVYGDGELFREYFNAIAAFFGTSNFNSLLNIAMLLAITTVIYSYISKRKLSIILKWMGVFYVAVYMIFLPKTSIVIVDRVNDSREFSVDHVPLGLAVLASYTSAIEDALTRSIEADFTMPDYMPYHKTGMVFASRLVESAGQFEIDDAEFDANLKEFVNQCVFYDLLLNKYSINELSTTNNIWEFVSANASKARAFLYKDAITSCSMGAKSLTEDWKSVKDEAISRYSQRIYPSVSREKAKQLFMTDLPMSYRYLTGISQEAPEIMQQNLMANAIQRGIVGFGARLDAGAALESYAFTRAQEQKRLTNQTMGDMAASWLPLIKIAFEVTLYASFIFIVLLSVFPFGMFILKNYLYSLLWIHTWAPLYAIINLMVSYHAKMQSVAAANGALSLKAMPSILQINSDIAGLAGYLSMMIPIFSTGLIFGMHKVLAQAAQYDGGVTQSVVGSGVSEAITGNLSFGNMNLGNQSLFNQSANHVDTSGRLLSGNITSQMQGGSLLTTTADGSHIMDMRHAISNLGASVHLSDGLRSSYSQQADKAYSAVQSSGETFSRSASAGVRNMYDLAHHLNQSQASGEHWAVTSGAGVVNSITENDHLTHEFAERHHLSYHDAANLLASAYVDGKASLGVGIPMTKVGVSSSTGTTRSASHNSGTDNGSLYSDAENFVRGTSYAKNVDTVSRASQDHSLRVNNEEGSRLVDSMGASFDKAESARHDMQAQYQVAESARQNATWVEEHADQVQVNASQHFADWLANQPGTNGRGRLGYHAIETLNNDPVLAKHYASQFVEQYSHELKTDWNKGLSSTKSQITHDFHQMNHAVSHEDKTQQFYNDNKNKIVEDGKHHGFSENHFINDKAKQDAEKQISNNQHDVTEKEKGIQRDGQVHQAYVDREEHRKRHSSIAADLKNDVDTTVYK